MERTVKRICLERTAVGKVQGQGCMERDIRQRQYPLDCINDRKFKSKVDWEELSGSDNEHLFTAENLERYKDYWNWSKLSGNSSVELTPVLLEQFADYWDWNEIIDCYRRDELYSMEFLEKYQDYIPASALQRSRLWDKLVEDEKKQLKIRILS